MVLQKLRMLIIFSIVSTHGEIKHDFQKSLLVDHCDKIYSLACFKLDVAEWLDKVDNYSEFYIIPGVTILPAPNSVKVHTSDIAAEIAREFPDDQDSRLDNLLDRKLSAYLSNHVMKINLRNILQDSALIGRKDKGQPNILLFVITTMTGIIGAIVFGVVTALGGKAFIASALALALSVLVGIREVLSEHKKMYVTKQIPLDTFPTPTEWKENAERRRSTHGFMRQSKRIQIL